MQSTESANGISILPEQDDHVDQGAPRLVPAPAEPAAIVDRAMSDLITRQRDRHGNRLPWSYSWSIPPVEDAEPESSPMEGALGIVGQERPLAAEHLRWFYRHRLLPAHQRLQQVRREVEGELRERIQRIRDHRQQVERKVEELDTQMEADARPCREELRRRDAELEQANREASARCARVGGDFDPENPSDEVALVPPILNRGHVLSLEQLPDTTNDGDTQIARPLYVALIVGVGALMGLSIALIAGFLHATTLLENWSMALLWALLGQCPAWLLGYGLAGFSRLAAEKAYNARPWAAVAGGVGLVILLGLLCLGVHTAVDANGILGKMRAEQSLSRLSGGGQHGSNSLQEYAMYLAALALVLGYCVYSIFSGWTSGRRLVVENRMTRRTHELLNDHNERRRAIPEVQQALESISLCREAGRQRQLAQQEVERVELPYLEEIALLEASVQSEPEDLTAEQKARLQDEYDNTQGALLEYETWFHAEKASVQGTFAERFWAWARPYRRTRGRR